MAKDKKDKEDKKEKKITKKKRFKSDDKPVSYTHLTLPTTPGV